MTKPTNYAFRRKGTNEYPVLVLFLGTGDSIDNYDDITKEEYDRIVAELDEKAKQAVPM